MPVESLLSTAEKNFILHWADDKYIMGHEIACQTRYYGPDLEENLALGSLAQDHLGHARLLYGLLGSSDLEIDRLVYLRAPSDYRNSLLAAAQRPDDWAFWVVKGLLYAQAELLRCRAIRAAWANQPECQDWLNIANIIIQDDAIHYEHWQQWLGVLEKQPEGSARLQAALDQLLPLGPEFFYSKVWSDLGAVSPDSRLLLDDWSSRLGALLQPLDFDLESLPQSGLYGADEQEFCGREGRHSPELVQMLQEAHSLYQSYPEAALGSV
jgi:ring-1,2-phenylacetyl-CoA epoxidase subunit PaaC